MIMTVGERGRYTLEQRCAGTTTYCCSPLPYGGLKVNAVTYRGVNKGVDLSTGFTDSVPNIEVPYAGINLEHRARSIEAESRRVRFDKETKIRDIGVRGYHGSIFDSDEDL